MQIKIKKLREDAVIPSYQFESDAGLDVCAVEAVTLAPGEIKKIPTGLSMELPHGFVSLIWDKSGLAANHGLKTIGGVIDAGYRGEYMIGMINLSQKAYTFEKGHKVAQILFQKIEHPDIQIVDELSDSHRGEAGFGSSGK